MSVNGNGRGGIIANVSSVAGISYAKAFPVYSGTKFGVIGFSKSVAVSYIVTTKRVHTDLYVRTYITSSIYT